ncbi:hypothetical protein BC828DRAFT_404162 [Blastocladiella britannica]|nr:hypothetical protein BC828DRAFT_404162 [Blastocladiella britannica]
MAAAKKKSAKQRKSKPGSDSGGDGGDGNELASSTATAAAAAADAAANARDAEARRQLLMTTLKSAAPSLADDLGAMDEPQLRARLAELDHELNEYRQLVDSCKKENDSLRQEIEDAQRDSAEYTTYLLLKRAEKQAVIDRMKGDHDQSVSDYKQRRSDLEARLIKAEEDLKADITELQDRLDSKNKEIVSLSDVLHQRQRHEAHLASLKASLEAARSEHTRSVLELERSLLEQRVHVQRSHAANVSAMQSAAQEQALASLTQHASEMSKENDVFVVELKEAVARTMELTRERDRILETCSTLEKEVAIRQRLSRKRDAKVHAAVVSATKKMAPVDTSEATKPTPPLPSSTSAPATVESDHTAKSKAGNDKRYPTPPTTATMLGTYAVQTRRATPSKLLALLKPTSAGNSATAGLCRELDSRATAARSRTIGSGNRRDPDSTRSPTSHLTDRRSSSKGGIAALAAAALGRSISGMLNEETSGGGGTGKQINADRARRLRTMAAAASLSAASAALKPTTLAVEQPKYRGRPPPAEKSPKRKQQPRQQPAKHANLVHVIPSDRPEVMTTQNPGSDSSEFMGAMSADDENLLNKVRERTDALYVSRHSPALVCPDND